MDRKEAIEIVRMCCPKITDSKCDFETAMRVLVPELKESEDERIIKAIKHLVKSTKENHFGIDNYDGIKWDNILAWLEKQGSQNLANSAKTCKDEQNSAWSEEDEAMLNSFIHLFRIAYTRTDDIDEKVEFLKSLKDRVQLQTKQEWSEEDKEALRVVTNIFEQHGIKLSHYPAFIHWLKTLPNRITFNPYWKPSDEQMKAFYKYLNEGDKTLALSESILLRHLYNDLKKLK